MGTVLVLVTWVLVLVLILALLVFVLVLVLWVLSQIGQRTLRCKLWRMLIFRDRMIPVSGIEYRWYLMVSGSIWYRTILKRYSHANVMHSCHFAAVSESSATSDSSESISTEKPWGSYVIILHPSVGWPIGNEVGPYRQDQSTSRADRRHGGGTTNLWPTSPPANHCTDSCRRWQCHCSMGVAQCWVSRHPGPPPQWCKTCRRIHVFNVGMGDVWCSHCEAWKLEFCDVCFGIIFYAKKKIINTLLALQTGKHK